MDITIMQPINEVQNTKEDIKNSILHNGEPFNVNGYSFPIIEPDLSGGLVTYADLIRNELFKLQGFDFSWIYDAEEEARANYLLFHTLKETDWYNRNGANDYYPTASTNRNKI